MKFWAGLCLMLALGATAAGAETPSPLKTNLFTPHEDVRAWSLQTRVEASAPVMAREVRVTEFTLKRERDRAFQAQLTIGTGYPLTVARVGDVRGQAAVTVHVYFRTVPMP